jgi:hypothetical protein
MKVFIAVVALMFAGCTAGPTDSEEVVGQVESSEQPLVVDGARLGPAGPSGTVFQGLFVLAFVGTDSQVNLVRQRPDGTWRDPDMLGEFTVTGRKLGASVIAFRSELHVTWVDGEERFCWKKSLDGVSFLPKTCFDVIVPGETTLVGEPALVIHRNEINVMYAHRPRRFSDANWDQHGKIQRRVLRDDTWLELESFAAQTMSTPSAVVLNDQLVAAWNHRDGESFRTAQFLDGLGWSAPNVIPRAHEGHLISAVTWPESLVWIYRETGGPEANMIKFDRTTDAVNFHWIKNTSHTSEDRPFGVMAADDLMRWAHVGQDGVRGLNFTVETL